MKLIYGFFRNIDRNIYNQEINFSNDFKVSYSPNNENRNQLIIEQKQSEAENFFGDRIESSILLLGKNGSGKTSIMDLIGSNEKTIENLFETAKYFLVYHLKENLFYFSGTIAKEIKNIEKSRANDRNFFFELNENSSRITFNEVKSNYINFNKKSTGIFYVRSTNSYPWSPTKKVFRGGNDKVLKYFDIKHRFEDILRLYSESDFVKGKDRQIEIHQKISYPKDQRFLAILNHFDIEDFSESSEEFLLLKSDSLQKLKIISRNYSMKRQEQRFDNCSDPKKVFFFRLCEKIILNILVKIEKESISNSKKYEILKAIFFNIKSYQHGLNELDDNVLEYKLLTIESLVNELSENKYCVLSHKKFLLLVENFIEDDSIPEEYFLKNEIRFPISASSFESDLTILFTQFPNIFSPKLGNLSDGELVYLNIYSKIYRILKLSNDQDAIILLDEPDSNLHPEWARRFIYQLYKLVNEEKIQGKVQIIISSHSPFLATDFPKENIYTLNRDAKKNSIEISNPKFGFAANIYDLISDTLFLESSIGEFALKKIQNTETLDNESKEKLMNIIDDSMLQKIFRKTMEF